MMAELIYSGILVRRDCIARHALSVTNNAFALGMSRQALSNLLPGETIGFSEMAMRIDKVFVGGVEIWLQQQTASDLAEAQQQASSLVMHVLTDGPQCGTQLELF